MRGITVAASVLCLLSLSQIYGQEKEAKPEPKRLAELRAKYDRDRVTALRPILTQYQRDLDGLQKSLTQAGDLDGALAVKSEIDGLAGDVSAMASGSLPKAKAKVVKYTPSSGWMDTGIRVAKGQRIAMRAQGKMSADNGGTWCDADGVMVSGWVHLNYMKDAKPAMLLAYISKDSTHYYAVGTQKEFVAQDAGNLFIGINDRTIENDIGELDVSITIQR